LSIQHHGTAADLCDLDQFFALTDCEYRYFVPKRLPQGKLVVAPGPAKSGKTTCLLQSHADLVYTGQWWGEKADPFPLFYLDYENDSAYVRRCILDPVMRGRDWGELKKWLKVSNRQVDDPRFKLPEYITTAHLDRLAPDQPAVFLIDSLRRAVGRTPGLKGDWEWSAATMNGILDPFSEWCHKSGHTVIFIHHTNHAGRSSGSTDIIAVPDVFAEFSKILLPNGDDTGRRKVSLTGRIDYTPPHVLDFPDGVYRYLGDSEQAKQQTEEETLAETLLKIVTHLQTGNYSGVELVGMMPGSGKANVYAGLNKLMDEDIVVKAGKKRALADGYSKDWHKLKTDLGIRELVSIGV
jgi:hypothetical protein